MPSRVNRNYSYNNGYGSRLSLASQKNLALESCRMVQWITTDSDCIRPLESSLVWQRENVAQARSRTGTSVWRACMPVEVVGDWMEIVWPYGQVEDAWLRWWRPDSRGGWVGASCGCRRDASERVDNETLES